MCARRADASGEEGWLKLRITIGGNTYEADVEVLEEEETVLPSAPAPTYAALSHAMQAHATEEGVPGGVPDKICRSPVTGLVIRVHVQAGQVVAAGETLLVLEAMKMETQIAAPCEGVVQRLHVVQGNSVRMGQVLVELE